MRIKVIKPKEQFHPSKLKTCAYVRVSTDSLEQEGSLENQDLYYTDLITSNPEYEFIGVFSDQGISGFYENRPNFQKMIDLARKGEIDLIITKSISRFARNTVTVLKFARELKELGVGIFFELQNINTLSDDGELMLTIMAAAAQAESESSSLNTSMSYRQKFEKGIPAVKVGKCYGFREDGNGNICIDEEKGFVVKMMYRLAYEGIWVSKIKSYLNKRGIPAPGGEKWNDTGVVRILRSEIYKGDVLMQKTYLDADRVRHKNNGERDRWYITNHHPAIVSNELWDKVQEILNERSEQLAPREIVRPKNKKVSYHTIYPLTGKLYCSKCGAVLHHKVSNRGKNKYWACGTNIKKSRNDCSGIWLPENVADEWNIDGEVVVFQTENAYGMREFSYQDKSVYERKSSCPYKPRKRKGRSIYPLSGMLYCSLCGNKLIHYRSWKGEEFWWCGKRTKRGEQACKGIRIPARIADQWGINHPVTVWEEVDKNGGRSYSYTSKSTD